MRTANSRYLKDKIILKLQVSQNKIFLYKKIYFGIPFVEIIVVKMQRENISKLHNMIYIGVGRGEAGGGGGGSPSPPII